MGALQLRPAMTIGRRADHSRSYYSSSFVLYLWLYATTRGVGRKSVFFSYQMLTDRTGLSKRSVQRAVEHLQRRQLIKVARKSPTAVPEYSVATPWVRG